MIEIRRILCPIDFSDYSRRALDHAVAVARWYDSSITVLHVFSAAPVAAYAPGAPGFQSIVLTQADRDQLLAGIQRFIDEEAAPGISMTPMLREGSAVPEILHEAERMRADLLVMGTHGRSGFERLLLGSVTEKVLHKAPCPVLTVPGGAPDAVPAAPVLFKRILCPVDFSSSSMRALAYALSLAKEADARLTVLHVLSPEMEASAEATEAMAGYEGLSLREYKRVREDRLRQKLNEAVPADAAEYCTVETLIAHGKAGPDIIRVASELQSDLIVIGVQGRGRLDLALFGSTTQHVVRHANCPVLTLRSA